ncbi:hypothetical protein [Emcibacter nanhaiensis]|uniref:Uncharacterized protein n=1 Tax=Emcibacter nanhaiensis TaxID=1505037 RepID=A0A501PN73_9PROT|nr:hypothetical protein [Emcibacter nanhaiensis]TPD61950.1 hypothetical protein FIV46_07030 [Emcibacter nanhaiensis]
MSLVGAFFTLSGVGTALAADLKGSISLAPEEVLISGDKPYSGQFDLREQWGDNPQLTLTRLVVTFHFRDNDQWQMKERRGRPEKDGRPLRTVVKSLVGSEAPALEQRYSREVYNIYSNPIEVARLQIGTDRFFAATSRRRLEERHDHGESRSFLGLKPDPETGNKVAAYSVTRRTLVEQWDGYADQFSIRNKILSLDALLDLAEDGVLPFTLDGDGDYLLVGATLDYEGYAYPGFNIAAEEEEEVALHVPLGLLGLIGGGGLFLVRRKTEQRKRHRRETARQKYGERRLAEHLAEQEQRELETAGQTS